MNTANMTPVEARKALNQHWNDYYNSAHTPEVAKVSVQKALDLLKTFPWLHDQIHHYRFNMLREAVAR